MDSDKILVMDGGSIVEYDHPYNLLQKQGGFFRNLVETTGKTTAKHLEKIATEVSIFIFFIKLIVFFHYKRTLYVHSFVCFVQNVRVYSELVHFNVRATLFVINLINFEQIFLKLGN